MTDLKVIPQILRPNAMRLAVVAPAVVAVLVGAPAVAVAWLIGWAMFLAWCVLEHRRRRLRDPRWLNPRAVMVDGRIIPLTLVADGNLYMNTNVLDGIPRQVLFDRLPPGQVFVSLRWRRDA